MTATTGLKRLGLLLLAVVAVGAGLLVTAKTVISADTVRAKVLSEIRAVTGLNPTLRGRVSVSLFPSGRVSFADVMLGPADKPALTAEKLTARLRFFPLLICKRRSPTSRSTGRPSWSTSSPMAIPTGPA